MSDKESSGCSVGCFGCLLEIIGFLGLLFLWFHRSQIWNLVIGR